MADNKIEKLWDGIRPLSNLRVMNLSSSLNVRQFPDLSTATNLKYLTLYNCSSLVELPYSVGNATNLTSLNLSKCSSLVKLPFSIGNATKLETLDLSNCSSLVELHFSIGNLYKLSKLNMKRCYKLKFLPININLESLVELDLSGCSMLKTFPEISTNIILLNLSGTTVEEVPSAIRSWSRLEDLIMSYYENLKEFSPALDNITELHLTDTGIIKLGPWVKRISHLYRLKLSGCRNLVAIPQLPNSLLFQDADNFEPLERLECSFHNPYVHLNFLNCFKLNQEASDLIIHTSIWEVAVLPGGEVPPYFTYQAHGSFVIVKLNERPLRRFTKFRACILLDADKEDSEESRAICSVKIKHNALTAYRPKRYILAQTLTEHMYTFDVEAKDVTSTELVFEFKLIMTSTFTNASMKIKECGIRQLLEVHVDGLYESFVGDYEDYQSSDEEYEYESSGEDYEHESSDEYFEYESSDDDYEYSDIEI